MFPVTGVLENESDEGESQVLSELKFGVELLRATALKLGPERWCFPTLSRFRRRENSSPCWPSPGLGGKLCIDIMGGDEKVGNCVDDDDERNSEEDA